MTLNYLLKNIHKLKISSIADNSQNVKKDSLFVAIKGFTVDAHIFIPDAIKKGAKIIIGTKNPKSEWLRKAKYIKVNNSRKALALIASAWHKNPSKKLKVIGVTGTDGKTTTATMIYHLLKSSGKKVGLITTVKAIIGNKSFDTGFHVTNPEPLELQKFLSKMVKAKCEFAVLEVTSHGIDQHRIDGINFDISVLTNITHEHIDYHKTFDNYKKTKMRFINSAPVKVTSNKIDSLTSQISENYNKQNMSKAIAVARLLKIPESKIKKAVKSFPGVKGRQEEIINKKGIKIYIDFAHTPNSLENVLKELRKTTKGKLICVFGCAGARDTKKRPKMANISTQIADLSILTAEDPRHENLEDIFKQMNKGIKKNANKYIEIPERGKAIYEAIIKYAKKGDTVAICGKGHEQTMNYNGIEYPWSDHDAVKLALNGKISRIK